MLPIHDLLARIRWDREYGRGHWEIGYLDRRQPALVRVPFDAVHMKDALGTAFEVVDEEGTTRSIPYHRVRMVWRDGTLVWLREAPPRLAKASKPPRARKAARQEPRMRR